MGGGEKERKKEREREMWVVAAVAWGCYPTWSPSGISWMKGEEEEVEDKGGRSGGAQENTRPHGQRENASTTTLWTHGYDKHTHIYRNIYKHNGCTYYIMETRL